MNDVIDLVTITTEQDADGFAQETESLFHCFADVESAKGVEFYTAANVGIRVTFVITINYLDYMAAWLGSERPSFVRYEDIKYKITRTYRIKKDNTIELTVSEIE